MAALPPPVPHAKPAPCSAHSVADAPASFDGTNTSGAAPEVAATHRPNRPSSLYTPTTTPSARSGGPLACSHPTTARYRSPPHRCSESERYAQPAATLRGRQSSPSKPRQPISVAPPHALDGPRTHSPTPGAPPRALQPPPRAASQCAAPPLRCGRWFPSAPIDTRTHTRTHTPPRPPRARHVGGATRPLATRLRTHLCVLFARTAPPSPPRPGSRPVRLRATTAEFTGGWPLAPVPAVRALPLPPRLSARCASTPASPSKFAPRPAPRLRIRFAGVSLCDDAAPPRPVRRRAAPPISPVSSAVASPLRRSVCFAVASPTRLRARLAPAPAVLAPPLTSPPRPPCLRLSPRLCARLASPACLALYLRARLALRVRVRFAGPLASTPSPHAAPCIRIRLAEAGPFRGSYPHARCDRAFNIICKNSIDM